MITAIVFLPLLGALGAGVAAYLRSDRYGFIASIVPMLLSMVLAWIAFVGHLSGLAEGGEAGREVVRLAEWISAGAFTAEWSLRYDTLTAVMTLVVTTVSAMVHVYSVGYMAHDASKPRFMAYLSFFTFAMLMLVTADNLVQMFFGWEGVGVASYLLIGFWYRKPEAHAAAQKAFVVNRVGDFFFMLGIFAVFALTRSVEFDSIFSYAPLLAEADIFIPGTGWLATLIPAAAGVGGGIAVPALELAGILLFIGAMGKSAQLGLHTWLPDAMEGPTPVSALIHAATMVTAGVFLVCRLSPMLEYAPFTLDVITIIGAATALFAATIGMTQFDIKRVIAYSTCSQLGYMFFAAGVSAYPAAMFHLTTHAFFKALLFLGAGSVIHAIADEQDMRNMGGLWRKIPVTYVMMWIGSLALAGFPFFAGYYSKDMILESAWARGGLPGEIAFACGIAAAALTAFYSWRLLLMTFHGRARAPKETMAAVHESPPVMTIPLFILAAGAVFSGFFFYDLFVGESREVFWGESIFILPGNDVIEAAHHAPPPVKWLPVLAGAGGLVLAAACYVLLPQLPGLAARTFKPIHVLFYNKWFFDEIYDALFTRPAIAFGRALWKRVDGGVIDAFGPDGISALTLRVARMVGRLQTGYVFHYAFAMLLGVVALLIWYAHARAVLPGLMGGLPALWGG